VTELVEATSRKVESRTRWEVEGRVRQEAEARARAERQAAVERKARERATRKGRRARWIAIIAIVLVVILAGLLGVGYWQYREHTARAVRHELAEVDQILTEAQAAQPDGAVALLTKAQARVDVARQLAVSWLTSDATRDEIARLDRTCKAARAAALFRHADRLIRLRRLGEAADVFEQAFAADPEQPPEQFIKVARTVANVLATVPTDSQTRVRLQAFLRRCIIDGVARYAQQAADAATTAARRQEIRNELRRCLNDDSLVLTDRDIERLVAEDRGAWRRLRADLDAALNSLPE
jgi:cobalamin biosynthesis Mg chelatase CobN